MQNMWNERFSGENFFYGTEPNPQVKEFLINNKPCNIFFPGEGEGRNAVYASKLAYNVVASDLSTEGKRKALQWAHLNNENINYLTEDILTSNIKAESFDVVVLCFMHLPAGLRQKLHKKFIELLKPNGKLFVVGFSTNQLTKQYKSGGPKDESMLYTEDLLKTDFKELEILKLKTFETELNEGIGHQGRASLVVFEAQKP